MAHHFYGDGRFDEVSSAFIMPIVSLDLTLVEKYLRKFPYIIDVAIFTITDYEYKNNCGKAKRVIIFIHLDKGGQKKRLRESDRKAGLGPVSDSNKDKKEYEELLNYITVTSYESQRMNMSFMHEFGLLKRKAYLGFTGRLGDLPIESHVVDVKRGENFMEKAKKLVEEEDRKYRERCESKNKSKAT